MLEALVEKTIRRIVRYAPPAWTAPITTGRGGGGWWRINEPYTGAWQKNDPIDVVSTISNPTVFACVTLIASSLAKLELQLVAEDPPDVWTVTSNPAYSALLRRPNRYQIATKFVLQWLLSKLTHGNAYVLKSRDDRSVVNALYPLDPERVTPLVAPDGAVYYRIDRDPLRGSLEVVDVIDAVAGGQAIVVPASELINDPMYPIFHPLIGVSPLFAAALPALQGLNIQNNSTRFFANGAQPSGILTAPQGITEAQATKLAAQWKDQYTGENAGKVAILTGDLKYTALSQPAAEAQLVEQLNWSEVTICSCYHVPPYLVGIGQAPPYGKQEALFRQFYTQALQPLLVDFEGALDDGLGLAPNLGTQLDPDGLIWLDTETRTKAAQESIGAGAVSPNEARLKYFGLGPVAGGDSPYMQQQNYSLEALAKRDAGDPFAAPLAPDPTPPPPAPDESAQLAAFVSRLKLKTQELYAG
jgi:HK97 family phage portal protein